MKLSQTVAFFGNAPCQDAYGTYTFTGSLDTSKKPLRDSQIAARRILTVEPTVMRPPRNALLMDGVPYVIGDSFPDYWFGEQIRDNWEIHLSTGIANVSSFAQAIAGTPHTTAYVGRIWDKSEKDALTTSEIFNEVSFYFGVNETVAAYDLIEHNGVWHLAMNGYDAASGFLVVHTQQIDGSAVEAMTVGTRTYVPVTDTWTTTPTSIMGVMLRWQDGFRYLSQGSVQYHRGDAQIIVRKDDATPVAGSTITVGAITYNVLSVLNIDPCWSCHVRPE